MRKGGLALLALAATLALGGCGFLESGGIGATKKSGKVGQTLTDGGLKVTVVKTRRSVPRPEDDVTGLGSPTPGSRFFGAKVKACNDDDQAIKEFDFSLDHSGGDTVKAKFPQQAASPQFESQRRGCGTGWLVFEVPTSQEAEKLKFSYDDTGSARPGDKERHARFDWDVKE